MPITTDLATDIGKVRLLLGDFTEGSGVMPDGSNFADTYITYFLTQESSNVNLAAAACCEVIAQRWMIVPKQLSADGMSLSYNGVADQWRQRGAELAAQVTEDTSSGVITLDIQDAYSTELAGSGSVLDRDYEEL